MCILCQRIILLEVRAVWSSSDGNGTRERSLVGRVVRERRPSWAGDDVNEKGPIPAAYWGAPPIVQTEQDQREMPDLGLDVEQALENTSGGSGSDRRSVSFLSSQNSQNSLERVQTSSTNRTKAALFGGKSHSKSSRRRISVPKSIAALAPGARQRRRSPSSIAITNGSGSGRSDQFRKSPSSSRAGTFVNTGAQQPSSPHSSPGQSTSETFATLAEADRSLALRMAGLDPHGEEQRDALRRADRRRAWAKRHANGEGADTFDLDDEGDEGRDDVFGAGAERVGEGEQEEDWETDRDTNGFGHGRDARAIPSSRGLEEEVELQDRASPTRRSGQGRSAIV